MRALQYHGRGDVRLNDVAEPEPRAGEVKIAVAATGICGSDIHEFRGGPIAIPMDADHPLTGEHAPVTLGHEYSGTVVAVGEGVTDIAVGRRVAVSAVLRCGVCPSCTDGNPQLCSTLGFHGLSGGGGGFALFDTVPAYTVFELPDGMSDEVGALIEPLATGVHAVARSGIGPGGTALVLGGGPIGLTTVVAALAAGAEQVVVSEPSAARAAAAAALGATTVLDPRETDVVAAVRDLTGGRGVDASFDAAAATGTFDTALGAVRARGTVVNVAVWEAPTPLQPNALLFTEAVITGALAYTPAEFTRAVEIARDGRFDLASMVTRTIALDEAVDGLASLAASPGDDIKVLVRPS
ncbi:2,3-butanediol dehydrogenase [Pseudonocardia alni]|uniref:2,3-butanediol dehydrogenase n=1 Tax=Pseudonocardia alni TaxID=33907 RepID=UPI0033245C15